MARKIYNKNGSSILTNLSFADLSAMLLIVATDREKGFNVSPQTRILIDERFTELKEEIYRRIYGCDPFVKKTTIDGEDPKKVLEKLQTVVVQDIEGNPVDKVVVSKDGTETKTKTFVVKKNVKKELKDELAQTFVVAEPKKDK